MHAAELVFPPETWHNHGSCVVEAPNGDLFACWFHGSGERKADDVKIQASRLRRGATAWSPRFTLADTPGYPDTNCCLLVDPRGRLWLFWPTILAHTWESALMKYRVSSDWLGEGPPRWDSADVLHVTPREDFPAMVKAWTAAQRGSLRQPGVSEEMRRDGPAYLDAIDRQADDELTRRLGWFTRAHPFVLDGRRLIVPLYSDGFSFSLMALSDDWGATWRTSTPLLGLGNIQPSLAQRRDGTLVALMRDNGPAPKRLHQAESRDGGETWSTVVDSIHPNSGSGAEVTVLRSGRWALVNNDLEDGRHRLTVSLSDDEGRTWPWRRALDEAEPGVARFHYPSVIQAADGALHATWSHHVEVGTEDRPAGKSIKHARFNEAWVMQR